MGEQSSNKQFEAFMKMYLEDRKAQEQVQRELHMQMEELSLSLATIRAEVDQSKDKGSYSRVSHNDRPRKDENKEENSGGFQRFSKLVLPRYDGLADPLGWLDHCEFFFQHQRTTEDEKVGIASFHLEGDALLWFLKVRRDNTVLCWDDFKEQCNLRFGPTLRCTKLGELAKLKQTGSVDDYQCKFEQLSAGATSLSADQEVELFISGLQEHLAVEIMIHLPMTLPRAMHLAKLYESRPGAPPHDSTTNSRRSPTTSSSGHRCKKLFWIEAVDDIFLEKEPAFCV